MLSISSSRYSETMLDTDSERIYVNNPTVTSFSSMYLKFYFWIVMKLNRSNKIEFICFTFCLSAALTT